MAAQSEPFAEFAEIEQLVRGGDFAKANATCRELLERDPTNPRAWYFLAVVAGAIRDLPAAENALRKALELDANNAEYWDSLSITLVAVGRYADAEDCSTRAVSLESSDANFRCNLGNARYMQKRWAEAAADYRQALALDSDNASAWLNLGAIEHNLKHLAAAEQAYERSLQLAPNNLDALINYGFLLCDRGRPRAALALLPKILQRDVQSIDLLIIKGDAHADLNQLPEAESAYRAVLDREPTRRQALHNLATVLVGQDRLTEADDVIERLLQAYPQSADGLLIKSKLLLFQADPEAGVEVARQAVAITSTAENQSKLLSTLLYSDKIGPEELLTEHCQWNAQHAEAFFPATPPGLSRRSGAPLNVGLVSADFKCHPTAHLALGALELLDRNQFALTCYSDVLSEDEFTARYRSAASGWRTTVGLTNEEVAQHVRHDEIDILLDLMGHNGKRLLVFARKPVPIQGTWLGYVGTTGVRAIDFLIADRFHVPEHEDRLYTERIVRMPNDYICFTPPNYAPAVADLPALATGHITFGCFNNAAKYSPRILTLWSQILHRVPHAKLLLKFGSLADRGVQERILRRFAEHGVNAARIVFEGQSGHAAHLAAYGRVDLALDTQPYSGGLTTCEALWMGVPVITFAGNTFPGRHSVSHLANSGNERFIARDAAEYVEHAVAWANTLSELSRVRKLLRDQVRNSPLCDAAAFARDFSTVLKQIADRTFGR